MCVETVLYSFFKATLNQKNKQIQYKVLYNKISSTNSKLNNKFSLFLFNSVLKYDGLICSPLKKSILPYNTELDSYLEIKFKSQFNLASGAKSLWYNMES